MTFKSSSGSPSRKWIFIGLPALLFGVAACGAMNPGDNGSGSSGTTKSGASGFKCHSNAGPGETVNIPGGEFIMGCNQAVDAQCGDDERPMRTVSLDGFEIQKTEVTQAQYAACVDDRGCTPPSCGWNCDRANLPATCVDRMQAADYCKWAGMRLPTEAEWEKAARGTDGRKFPWGNQDATCDLTNMAGCGDAVQKVGSHPGGASPYGALDMAGNVVELVRDRYSSAYYASAPNTNPPGPEGGSTYVGRGGGWKSQVYWQRASARDWYDPGDAGGSLGFRCAH